MLTVSKGCTTTVIDSLGLAFDEEVFRWANDLAKTGIHNGFEVTIVVCEVD